MEGYGIMCRNRHTGKRCSDNWSESQKQADLARRRQIYQGKKSGAGSSGIASNGDNVTIETITKGQESKPGSKFSPVQLAYFKDSKAVDTNGEPITLYHGSDNEFDSFNTDTLGRGNDTWGNGFYFTNQEGTAKGYASDSTSPEANVKEFHLNLTNPIMVDGMAETSLANREIDKKTVLALLRSHPAAYAEASDDDDAEISFLSDYQPDQFWSKKHHTKAEFDKMINNAADEYFTDASWGEMENLYGKDHGSKFLEVMHQETGNDGVVVDFGEAGKHYVAWFPNQMKLTNNENPDDGNKF